MISKSKKKLTPRARKKELTGINLASIHRQLCILYDFLTQLEKRIAKLERKK